MRDDAEAGNGQRVSSMAKIRIIPPFLPIIAATLLFFFLWPSSSFSLTRTQSLTMLKLLEEYEDLKTEYIKLLMHADDLRAQHYSMEALDLNILALNIHRFMKAIESAEEKNIYHPKTPEPEQRFWYAIQEAAFAMYKAVTIESTYQNEHYPFALLLRAKYEDTVRSADDEVRNVRTELGLQ